VLQAPIMVVDQDHSSVSRTLIRSIRATDSLSVKTETQNISDFFPAVQRGDIWGCVVIPRDFETDIDSGRQAKVLVFVDGGNVLNGNVIIKVMRTILATFRVKARATRLGAGGIPSELALADAMPIQAEARPIFNPTYNYATFMLIGLACIALQQCTLMGAAAGLWSVKIEPKKTGWIASFSLFMGKTAAHLLIMLLVSTLDGYLYQCLVRLRICSAGQRPFADYEPHALRIRARVFSDGLHLAAVCGTETLSVRRSYASIDPLLGNRALRGVKICEPGQYGPSSCRFSGLAAIHVSLRLVGCLQKSERRLTSNLFGTTIVTNRLKT
jgi:ABC-2 type transport system permease protein